MTQERLSRTETRRTRRESLSYIASHVSSTAIDLDECDDEQSLRKTRKLPCALVNVYNYAGRGYIAVAEVVDAIMENVQETVRPQVLRLPRVVTYFLGWREADSHALARPQIIRTASILLTTFAALSITGSILSYAEPFRSWGSPAIIPSFGATAILLFNATGAPFSQPRHMIIATTFSATIGIAVAKLFEHNPSYERFVWVGAPIVCSLSSVIMDLTGTIHPPAGAVSILPFINDSLRELGWKLLVLVLVSESVFLACALFLNNILLRYPLFWWTPSPPLTYPVVAEPEQELEPTNKQL